MSDHIAARLANLKPFGKQGSDDDDQGGQIDIDSVGGGGRHNRKTDHAKEQLRVSRALRIFLAKEGVIAERDAALDTELQSDAVRKLLSRTSFDAPEDLLVRSHPLPEYFISSSHNTYLIAHQLYGTSSASAYETALKTGSRCVEIDAWDNSADEEEPKVTHGYTLVSHIPFRAVCETIRNRPGLHLRAVRELGHREQEDTSEHVSLQELGPRIAVIVEHHIPGEVEDSDSPSSSESDDEEEKRARKEYKASSKEKEAAASIIVPELAELGVYAQSVKPSDNSWYDPGQLVNGPHHHLINVSESGLAKHLPANSSAIAIHNSQHLMRVYPKGTRIGSSNLKPVSFWGIGAQICALNWQTFGTSNQLNDALFSGSEGYVLKPAALRAGGNGVISTGRKEASPAHIPLHEDREADSIKPYLTCNLYSPCKIDGETNKRKTSPYKHHKLGILHRGDSNPPATDPLWHETLEWTYEDNELVFLRMLIKSDDAWARNPMFAVAAVRLEYTVPGWSFIRLMDMKGGETKCTVLVRKYQDT
ncbi:hypothetical protein ACCO45_012256 [Purpureocillium lilacinum]|uniref:Uncharacterized protein n=1 Tax=Purpureocillium lilacinum TaxID=33203 RepID=A0ACC4DD57_PURLI